METAWLMHYYYYYTVNHFAHAGLLHFRRFYHLAFVKCQHPLSASFLASSFCPVPHASSTPKLFFIDPYPSLWPFYVCCQLGEGSGLGEVGSSVDGEATLCGLVTHPLPKSGSKSCNALPNSNVGAPSTEGPQCLKKSVPHHLLH